MPPTPVAFAISSLLVSQEIAQRLLMPRLAFLFPGAVINHLFRLRLAHHIACVRLYRLGHRKLLQLFLCCHACSPARRFAAPSRVWNTFSRTCLKVGPKLWKNAIFLKKSPRRARTPLPVLIAARPMSTSLAGWFAA